MMQNSAFECAPLQSHRSELMSTIGTIMAANIVEVMIVSSENPALVENYVKRILRLKKRDLEDAEYVGVPS